MYGVFLALYQLQFYSRKYNWKFTIINIFFCLSLYGSRESVLICHRLPAFSSQPAAFFNFRPTYATFALPASVQIRRILKTQF